MSGTDDGGERRAQSAERIAMGCRSALCALRYALAAALLPGCVTRELHVRSDPPGALVYLNDREVGRTPFDREFTWYGNYDVAARLDGYDPVVTTREVTAPWWQFVPFDAVTDFLPVRDDETIAVRLTPTPPVDPPAVLARAEQFRGELQSGQKTAHRSVLDVRLPPPPTTPPTTTTTTRPVTRPTAVEGQEP